MKKIFYFIFLFLLNAPVFAAVVTQTVQYQHENATLEGYLAYDDSVSGKRPVVLVVHEWKGLDDYAKKRTEQLAQLGYLGFAIDMYGKGLRAKDHEEAAQLSGVYRNDRNLMRSRAKAALDFIQQNELADPNRIAAIGYCFGGTTVLEMARAGFALKGVASFHGALDTPVPAKEGEMKSKVMVFHGANDSFVKSEQLDAFKDEMKNAKADWQLVIFSDAVHSFTVPGAGDDPSKGIAYNKKADERSWEMLKLFLNELFLSEIIP